MNKLAITFPGSSPVPPHPDLKSPVTGKPYENLADFISPMLNIIFYIVLFLAFYYLIWGAFQYIMARGDKEGLQRARSRITWALVGLIVVFLSFIIARFAREIFTPTQGGFPF